MGILPNQPIKLDTIKKYITLIGGLINVIQIVRAKPDGTTENFKPLVRIENFSKAYYRQLYNIANAQRDIKTNGDIYKFPIITYKLASMNQDIARYGISPFKAQGTVSATNVSQYLKTPVPYDFSFTITLWSNLYSDLLNFIENFTYIFTPADTFTVTTLQNKDKTFSIYHDTVIYLNSVTCPPPVDTIDDTTQEPIQSVEVNLVLKGILIPPIHDVKIIKYIHTNFIIDP